MSKFLWGRTPSKIENLQQIFKNFKNDDFATRMFSRIAKMMILRPRGRTDVRSKGIGAKKALVAKYPENVKNGHFYKRSYEGFEYVNIGQDVD